MGFKRNQDEPFDGELVVVVIGQTKALAMAVKRLGSVKRLTNPQARFRQALKGQEHGI